MAKLPLESRCHAAIIPTPEGPLLVDQSRHGILLNEQRIESPRVLADGETLRIGDNLLRVQLEVRPESPTRLGAGGKTHRSRLGTGLRVLSGIVESVMGLLAADFDRRRPGGR